MYSYGYVFINSDREGKRGHKKIENNKRKVQKFHDENEICTLLEKEQIGH